MESAASRHATAAQALLRFPELWVAATPGLYLALALAPPLLAAAGHPLAAHRVFVCFKPFCHQLPERSLFLFGSQVAVCARCFALALGLVAGAAFAGRVCALAPSSALTRVPFLAVALSAFPMAVDGFTQLFGLRESTNTLRVLTGLLLGGTTALWAVPIVWRAFEEMRNER